jgi:putative membrane protein
MFGLLPFHLGPFLQIVLVGMIAYVLLRRFGATEAVPAKGQSPADILKRRYALGELDQETFVRMMKELG